MKNKNLLTLFLVSVMVVSCSPFKGFQMNLEDESLRVSIYQNDQPIPISQIQENQGTIVLQPKPFSVFFDTSAEKYSFLAISDAQYKFPDVLGTSPVASFYATGIALSEGNLPLVDEISSYYTTEDFLNIFGASAEDNKILKSYFMEQYGTLPVILTEGKAYPSTYLTDEHVYTVTTVGDQEISNYDSLLLVFFLENSSQKAPPPFEDYFYQVAWYKLQVEFSDE